MIQNKKRDGTSKRYPALIWVVFQQIAAIPGEA